jgi:hypothetical protein
MMLTNVTIELSGMKNIVIDQTKVYSRDANNDWVERGKNKVILDHIMMRRIKKMLKEDVPVYGSQIRVNYTTGRVYEDDNCVIGHIKKYRLWTNMDTINIEKNLY